MTAGELSKRVTIQRPTRGKVDAETNEVLTVWEDIATVYASIEPLTSKEAIRAKAAEVQTTHRIRMRWTPVLTSEHRLSYPVTGQDRPRILSISKLVNVGERNREYEISAIEVINGQTD